LGKSAAQIFQTLEEAFEEHGSLFRYDLSPFHSTVMIADPRVCEALLSSQKLIEKSDEYSFIKSWLGDGNTTL
jgi:cytochrome P450 family 4